MQYPKFEDAIKLCIQSGVGCAISKPDLSAAFRQAPMSRQSWKFLIMKAVCPTDGLTYYFVGKCMPFGASISCAHFQKISDAVAHIWIFKTKKDTVNYLDDFFFAVLFKLLCDQQMKVFMQICDKIKFPISLEKVFWGTTQLRFLGLLIDTIKQLICIPKEKISKALDMIDFFVQKKGQKVTVLQVQQLCGYLNFLCKCIIPGRVFLVHLYSMLTGTQGKPLKSHYHVRVKEEQRLDLLMWRKFLTMPDVYCRLFLDYQEIEAADISMYSDASGKIGFGAICGSSWMFGEWSRKFLDKQEPSIKFLELSRVSLTAGVIQWIHRFRNRRICLFCDNISAVHMVNNTSSKCKHCMILLRKLVLKCLEQNVKIRVKYVNTKDNGLADSLSHLDFK